MYKNVNLCRGYTFKQFLHIFVHSLFWVTFDPYLLKWILNPSVWVTSRTTVVLWKLETVKLNMPCLYIFYGTEEGATISQRVQTVPK